MQACAPAGWEHAVVQQRQAQGNRQKIEEPIIAGRRNHQLQAADADEGEDAANPRPKDQQRQEQLHDKRDHDRQLLKPQRRLLHPPAGPHGQRLRLVVVVQGRQAHPRWVLCPELDHARQEHQLE